MNEALKRLGGGREGGRRRDDKLVEAYRKACPHEVLIPCLQQGHGLSCCVNSIL